MKNVASNPSRTEHQAETNIQPIRPFRTIAPARLTDETQTIYFLLPAYNEEENIGKQLTTIRQLMEKKGAQYTVVVVNDGSRDRTESVVNQYSQEMPIKLINHEVNKGVGKAFQTGFAELARIVRDDDIIITMDADNTQNLKTVELMVNKINAGYEVVVGSCLATGGMMIGVPFLRYILTRGCNFLYRVLFHIKGIHTYTGFYRAYSGAAIRKAYEKFGDKLIESDGFVVMAEMLIKFRQIPLFITEAPMIVRYDLKGGASKMRIWRTIRSHLRVIMANIFKRRIV